MLSRLRNMGKCFVIGQGKVIAKEMPMRITSKLQAPKAAMYPDGNFKVAAEMPIILFFNLMLIQVHSNGAYGSKMFILLSIYTITHIICLMTLICLILSSSWNYVGIKIKFGSFYL